jgi:hypothetical protein
VGARPEFSRRLHAGARPEFSRRLHGGACGVRMHPTFENVGHPPLQISPAFRILRPAPTLFSSQRSSPCVSTGVPQVVPTWGKPNQPAPQHRAILHPSPHAEFSRRHFLLMGVPQVVPTWVNPISPPRSTGSSCTHHRTPRARKAGDPVRKSPAVIASMATRSVDSRSVDPRQKISGCRAGPTSKIDCVLSSVVESGNAWNACT